MLGIKEVSANTILFALYLVTKLYPTLCNLMDFKPARFLCLPGFPGKDLGVSYQSVSREFSQPKD